MSILTHLSPINVLQTNNTTLKFPPSPFMRIQQAIAVSILSITFAFNIPKSSAEGIGINFTGNSWFLQPGDRPGVVQDANWNNVSGTAGLNVQLFDSTAALTNTLLSFNSASTHGGFDIPNTPNAATNLLYSGGLVGDNSIREVSLSLTNIPYTSYDVYVYASQDSHLTNTLSVTDGTTTFYYRGAGQNNTAATSLLQTTSSDFSNPTSGPAQYQIFRGLSDSTFSLSTGGSINGVLANHVFGLQVVQTSVQTPRLFGLAIGQNDGHQARGDIAAQAVFDKLSSKPTWASVSEGNTSAPLVFESNFNDHLGASVSSRLDSMQVRAGDTVVFFYNGHGGPLSGYGDGGETAMDLGLFGSNSSTDDEIFASDLSDDDLYQLFNTDKWRDVRKIFLLDSCHSGGFIGSSASDVGDLEKLSNFALFASALEDGLAQGDPFDGQGIWSKYLLLPSLDDADLTTMSLQVSINSRLGSIIDSFSGQTVPLFDMNAPGTSGLFSMTPYSIVSSDFDAASPFIPVPEPSTVLLAIIGFVFIFSTRSLKT